MDVVTVEQRGAVSIIRINRPRPAERDLGRRRGGTATRLRGVRRLRPAGGGDVGAGDRAFTAGADVYDLPELWRCIPGVGFRPTSR